MGHPVYGTCVWRSNQSTLFLRYAYAHFLIRKVPSRWQFIVHAVVLAAAFSVLPVLPGVE